MKEIKCGSVIPGCNWMARADSEAEVIRRLCDHVRSAHQMSDITPKMMQAIKAQVQSEMREGDGFTMLL